MGYMQHHAIVVTGYDEKAINDCHAKAVKIFGQAFGSKRTIVSPVIEGAINTQFSFFVAPDGSKEGWEHSQRGDDARKQFMDLLAETPENGCDFVEIRFGGDDDDAVITRKGI